MAKTRAWTLVFLLLVFLLGVAPTGPSVPAASQFGLLSIFLTGTEGFLGLSLVNTAAVRNDITITWTDSDGNSSRTANLSLAPGSQRVALVREILGIPADPAQGWIRIDSSTTGLLSYLTSGQDGLLEGTDSVSTTTTRMVLPHVWVNTGFTELDHADTLVNLINPGSAPATANADLIGLDGVVAGSFRITVPALGCRTMRVSESFLDALPKNGAGGRTFSGYLKITSDAGLAGWLCIDTPLSRGLLRGRGVEEIGPVRLAMVGHFALGSPSLYLSALNLINAGGSAVTFDLAARLDGGGGFSARRTLGPGQGIREDVLSLFGIAATTMFPPPLLSGYIRIQAADGGEFQLIGDIEIARSGHAAAMLYAVGTASSSDATMPFVINDSDYFTGYAIANPNEMLTVQTDVTIELLDSDGRTVGTPQSISLSPSSRFVGLVQERARGGYLRISANAPVAVLGSIGRSDGSALASLPGLP